MLKSCIHPRKLQDYSHSTSYMLEAPLLSPESWKGKSIMDKEHIVNNDVEEFTPPQEEICKIHQSVEKSSQKALTCHHLLCF
jgi:hypothetical protein